MRRHRSILPLSLIGLLLWGGCASTPGYQKSADDRLAAVTRDRQSEAAEAALPARPTPADYLRFALNHHPAVIASYAEWQAGVRAIGPAGALPDPKLTLQADIASSVMSVMPGIMFDFLNTGKREAMGRAVAAGAEVARRRYAAAAETVARNLRQAWIELAYIEAARQLHLSVAASVDHTLALSDADYQTGRSMAGLGMQLGLQTTAAEHRTLAASLDDRLQAARVAFKSALGLAPADANPPWPDFALTVEPLPDEAALWSRLLAHNPELATIRAQVEQAVAAVTVAEQAGTPGFSLGAMVDVKSSPLMFRPTASLSLPIWRQRIADEIAAAQARRAASAAKVDAATLDLAARLARSLYQIHRDDRMLGYLADTALPNLDRSIAAAAADYESGRGSARSLTETDTRRTLLHLNQLDLLRARADAVTDILFLTASLSPADSLAAQN